MPIGSTKAGAENHGVVSVSAILPWKPGRRHQQAQQSCELSLPRKGRPEVAKMNRCPVCGAWKAEDELGLRCCRCDKIIGDVQADLMAEFDIRDNVV